MSAELRQFEVAYQFGPYSGRRTVVADDEAQAIAKVRKWARSESTLSMAYESYHVVGEAHDEARD